MHGSPIDVIQKMFLCHFYHKVGSSLFYVQRIFETGELIKIKKRTNIIIFSLGNLPMTQNEQDESNQIFCNED